MGLALFFTFFLVFLNGFFVAAEFALVKVRASQIEIKAKTGSRVAKIAKHMTQHLDGYLAATQLGITLASLGLGWVGEAVMTDIVSRFFNFLQVDMSSLVATEEDRSTCKKLKNRLTISVITASPTQPKPSEAKVIPS